MKEQKRIFEWEYKNLVKVTITEPEVEYNDEYTPAKDINDIMYMYYTVNYYVYTDMDSVKGRWKKIYERSVYEWASLGEIIYLLKYMLEAKPDNTWQIDEKRNGDKIYTKFYDIEGFCNDDYMSIVKTFISDERCHYTLNLSGSADKQGGKPYVGFTVYFLDDKDIKGLIKVLEEAVNTAIKKENKRISENYKISKTQYKYNNGRIIESCFKNQEQIENVYIKGDYVEITHKKSLIAFTGNTQGIIKNITKSHVIIERQEDIYYFPYSHIMYISNIHDPNFNTKAKYNLNECVEETIKILSDEDKNKFRTSPLRDLYKEYMEIVINRNILCREEHGEWGKTKKDKVHGIESGKIRARDIIREIRNRIRGNKK